MAFKRLATAFLTTTLFIAPVDAMTLNEAVTTAVNTNPEILEAAANRRARDQELRRSQGAFLPRLDVGAEFGAERIDRPNSLLRSQNDKWRAAKQVSLTVRQLLFDGFGSVNEVYRQSARVDGAALRVLERSEATALDAVEAYVDVLRHVAILEEARRNVGNHQRILSDVQQRYSGGETGAADLNQAVERVAATKIVVADIKKSLLEANAKFRRVIGQDPAKLMPATPASLPARTMKSVIAAAVGSNPQVQAALADADASKFEFQSTDSAFMPRVSVEGRVALGDDLGGVEGRNNDYSAKLVMSWNLYNGGMDLARKREYGERLGEAQLRVDVVRREITEAVERSWAAVVTVGERIQAIQAQVEANRRVVDGYRQEYNIGQRSLLDVLNAENALFNSKIDLISARGIYTFSTYQLRATSGNLLAYLNVAPPAEATAGRRDNVSVFPQSTSFYLEPLRKF